MLGPCRFLNLRRLRFAVLPLVAVPALAAAPAHAASGWSIQPTPGSGVLRGVSCLSPTACFAVGMSSSGTLAERWNGHAWEIKPTPSGGGVLNAVSCTAPNACMAVGAGGPALLSNSGPPLAERWNGRVWKIEPTPNPGGTLYAVSCTAVNACIAVGGVGDGAGGTPGAAGNASFVERWNGKRWALQDQNAVEMLDGVSCTQTGARNCAAVGYTRYAYKYCSPFLGCKFEATDDTVEGQLPNLAYAAIHAGDYLNSVSCTSQSACTAVGDTLGNGDTVVEVWNGSSWRAQTLTPPSYPTTVTGVSCTAATACAGVGSSGGSALAEGLTGSTWTVQPTPTPSGATSTSLAAVSCPTSGTCVAVGNYVDRSGTAWTLVESDSP